MKIVLDASVIVAAFAAHGLCEAVFELCLDSHQILISTDLIDELKAALRKKIKLPAETVESITALIRENATMVVPAPIPKDSCRDPNDLHILGLVAAGEAEYLITGDNDLLVLEKFRGCRILSPREFSTRIHAKQ
jgi:putative PIN family toxin of toxin-antitoxin system